MEINASMLKRALDINLKTFEKHALHQLVLNRRQLCDLELLLNRGFAPLNTFLNKKDYESVLANYRLSSGQLWPMPIMLDVDEDFLRELNHQNDVALCDEEGLLVAMLSVEESWNVNKEKEALALFGTVDQTHPGVAYLFQQTKNIYISGNLKPIALPCHYDFVHLRHSPNELKEIFEKKKWQNIIAFQTRNPMHRAHQQLTLRAAELTGANILIHPVVGMTKPGDIEYYTRVKCYEHILKTYEERAFLSLLPLAMRMAGPREALWHALIRKNYGCTHFIIGRDHAGPGKNKQGKPFYEPYAAQSLAEQYEEEMNIKIIPFQEMVYSEKHKKYYFINEFPKDDTPAIISGTELRERLQKNQEIPEWFSYPTVIEELRKIHPAKHKQGFTIFFTGLPSSGKSTLANALLLKLREMLDRPVTLLDGDIIRHHLSKGLGFSREDRETNIARVGFVAKEITKHGGIVICALVAPYEKTRSEVKQMIKEGGGFIEVYVSTPLTICEERDRKGLYKKAREGLIQHFTGVSDDYESPLNPDMTIDTTDQTPRAVIQDIISKLKELEYIR